jgi:threonine synthase
VARMMGLPIRKLILATNENDVLDEFFRTRCYRPRETAETLHTSSPSMDISKASNFERFIFDLTTRDAARVKELWSGVDAGGSFNLDGTPYWERISDFGLVSGTSSHSARIEMIRKVYETYGILVDPHTADGLKVGLEHREAGVPLVCLETALPVKFSESIVEAIGREPARPAGYENIEDLPQRYVVMNADADVVKAFIAEQARQD